MTDSSMLKYQYDTILDQLILLQLHAESPDCPCSLQGTHPGELGEFCEPKHLRSIVALARETIAMEEDEARLDYLENLVLEGSELLGKMENKLCDREVDLGDYVTWSREKRKPLEEWCYSGFCNIVTADEALVEEIAGMFRKKAEPRWCFPVKETDKELGKLSRTLGTAKRRITEIQRHLEVPLNICRGQAEMFESTTGVLDPYGSRCRDPKTGQWMYSEECGFEPAGITTTALGMDGITRYEFEFKIVSLDKLIVSHDPFTFTPNPNYPEELQPRLRERAATKIQVEKIAANLEPDAVITDFHVIDRGTPIVGPDSIVEAGNGRVMGIIKAAADYPDKYARYKDRLRERAHDYGLSPKDVDSIETPVLIRVRITDVDRTLFTQEANQAATIAPSAIENARTDALKITMGMLQELIVGENESLEDALRAPKNQAFAKRFLATLPENVQAALVDAQGYLNRDGVHRMAMAIFVSAFQGDAGLRLAEKAFESIDMDVRNTVNAIARSLGPLAQAEALTRTGERDTALSIGDDLAQTINVYSAIKRNPALTVEKYLAQEQIFARELTPFQEGILVVLDEYKRSPRKLAGIFTAYAEGVIKAPPPAQAALFPGAEVTKEGLWESAVKAPEAQPALMEVARMFEETCERPSAKYQHLSAFFTETAAEAALFAAEEGKIERKIDTVLAQLESGIAEIHESSKFKDFIDTMSRFHNYSLGNIMLITLQRPDAARVAGYRIWQDLGRNVKKSEHGIMILAPCFAPRPKKEEVEDGEEIELEPLPVYFKVVHVFDIGQTEGKELPTIEVPVITGDETGPLFQDAATYVAKQGITMDLQPRPDLDPDLMGFWSKPNNLIWVRPDAPQDQRTKTLLHEIAHSMCERRGARDAEVMAESVAYTVANHFGFDTGVRSFPYVAVWAGDVKVLKSNLEIIRKVAKDMIEGIEQVAGLSDISRWKGPAYRAESGYRHDPGQTAGDVVRYEQEELGNDLGVGKDKLKYLDRFPANAIKWVSKSKKVAAHYNGASPVDVEDHIIIAEDGDGGYLVLDPDRETKLAAGLSEIARMFEKQGDKHDIIKSILDMEIWLGQLDLGKTRDRVKSLAKLKLAELELLWRDLLTTKYDWEKVVEQSVYSGLGKKVPAYLQEVAEVARLFAPSYLPLKFYLVSVDEGIVLPLSFITATKAFNYAQEHDIVERGYTGIRGKSIIRLIEKGVIKEGKLSEKAVEVAKMFAPMKLLTKEIRDKLPALYSQEKVEDPMVQVKFFTPDSNWTWYGIEFDGDDTFFGWVVGFEKELGYFSLRELESARGPLGLAIERDKWFSPMPLSEVKKLHAHERGELGNERSSAGFPLNQRDQKPEDIDRFYAWTDKASSGEVLSELCERADYLGAHLCLAKEGDDVDKEWMEKCPYIGTEEVYTELSRLRFLCWKLTGKLPSSVTILGGEGEMGQTRRHYFCDWMDHHPHREIVQVLSDEEDPKCPYCKRVMTYGAFWGPAQAKAKLAQGTVAAIGSAAITGIGIGAGFKFVDWLAKTFSKKELNEEEGDRRIPAYIDVSSTTIAKHYRSPEDFHEGSIRVVKPEKDILVYLGCLKSDDWDGERCSSNPTVVKTIVPDTKKYRDELDHLKLVHPEVKINYLTEEVGVEPVLSQDEQEELKAVGKALEKAEVRA